ncbi:hypothetical protein ACRALDRAFT_2104147, partial [Sodiomyces alcalophilus JCM 7366]|uniref:uncharacterized protein n=1 Tax=Sodiomyces alcalophilus JCM 7366 TaxID=591952 RepID=UPI0039B6206B
HLERLSTILPDRFRPQLNELKTQLPSLFCEDFPIVINHWDLLENNIHVDVQTGSITGIVDWRDAKIGPFGTQFWGLENLLGVRTGNGMRFHQRHVELRRLFWETLYAKIGDVPEDVRAAIQTARMIGIYLANDDFDDKVPVEEGTRELAVLESVTLGLQDTYL